jgi:hypothetical protein
VKPKNVASFNALTKLYERQNSIYDFWTEPRSLNEPIDIMVPPTHAKEFERILGTYNLEHRVKIQDVQRLVIIALLKSLIKKFRN